MSSFFRRAQTAPSAASPQTRGQVGVILSRPPVLCAPRGTREAALQVNSRWLGRNSKDGG